MSMAELSAGALCSKIATTYFSNEQLLIYKSGNCFIHLSKFSKVCDSLSLTQPLLYKTKTLYNVSTPIHSDSAYCFCT